MSIATNYLADYLSMANKLVRFLNSLFGGGKKTRPTISSPIPVIPTPTPSPPPSEEAEEDPVRHHVWDEETYNKLTGKSRNDMEKMAAGKSFEDLDKVKERYGKAIEYEASIGEKAALGWINRLAVSGG